ncbi:MAG: hypothetical protein EOO20_05405 [Chryseobacterium sp.]|nr:MAG: hypothetical protein EOO20_05405 [Chryseobacterium sp.]
MISFKLDKVERDEIIVLQDMVADYTKSKDLVSASDIILSSCIGQQLYKFFRTKTEAHQTIHTFTLKPSWAIILYRSCLQQWFSTDRTEYEINVARKYSAILDNKIKNINLTIKS